MDTNVGKEGLNKAKAGLWTNSCFSPRKLASAASVHANPFWDDLSISHRGSTTIALFGMNLLNQDVRPKKDLNEGRSVGAGAFAMASTESGLGCSPSSEMSWPRYRILLWLNLLFSMLSLWVESALPVDWRHRWPYLGRKSSKQFCTPGKPSRTFFDRRNVLKPTRKEPLWIWIIHCVWWMQSSFDSPHAKLAGGMQFANQFGRTQKPLRAPWKDPPYEVVGSSQ